MTAVDPLWSDFENDSFRRLAERVAEVVRVDPDDCLGLVTDNLVITPIQNGER
ncbi:hypothetical protein ACIGG9_16150 [Pseudonocardia alni]|uniref:hypothetical protein n=1 Tax=Pseudonocardia alni TaxID=33907 RepID=UPI0033C39FFD